MIILTKSTVSRIVTRALWVIICYISGNNEAITIPQTQLNLLELNLRIVTP